MTLPLPHTVLFDWDNTLVDTWGVIHMALNSTFVALGHRPWSLDETQARVRRSARETFPEMFGDQAEEAIRIFYATFEANHIAYLREQQGALAMLERLASSGYRLAVVSNKTGHLLRREAAHLDWSRFFDTLVGAGDAARDKPDPAAVAAALDPAPRSVPGGRQGVWFVGDTDIDLMCARNSGCVPVLLREAAPSDGEFRETPPRIYTKSCRDLADMLSSNC